MGTKCIANYFILLRQIDLQSIRHAVRYKYQREKEVRKFGKEKGKSDLGHEL